MHRWGAGDGQHVCSNPGVVGPLCGAVWWSGGGVGEPLQLAHITQRGIIDFCCCLLLFVVGEGDLVPP